MIFVDGTIDGSFVYYNNNREIEGVHIVSDEIFFWSGSTYTSVDRIYIGDIPNMILALQAAYDNYKKDNP